MGLGRTGGLCETQDEQQTDVTPHGRPEIAHPDAQPQASDAFMSPEVRVLLEQDAGRTGLEVDEDGDDEADMIEEAGERPAPSVHAMSTFRDTQHHSYQVELLYDNGLDSATIDSSRTLYADDFDFVEEHGRQYCGDYFLPIDQTEQTRQYAIHQAYLQFFGRELTTVPLEDPRYILDIGTGIGEWAIGMAEKYPECEVFGTDIAPVQPTHQVPFNVEFHIENAEEEWIRPADAVDLVHLRNMEGAFSDWSFIYREAFACIRPGGWIEVLDWEDFFADRNFLSFFPEGSALRLLTRAVLDAAEHAGKPLDVRHLDGDLLSAAGFVDVRQTVYDVRLGSREANAYSKFWLFAIVTGVEATCLRLLTRHLGWDADEVRRLCDKAAREIRRVADDPAPESGAFVLKLRVVVGRKPAAMPAPAPDANGHENGDDGDVHGQSHSGDESTIGRRTIRSEETT